MRNTAVLFLAFAMAILSLSSCSEKDESGQNFITHPEFTKSFTKGQWRISNYKVNGKELTRNYQDFTFAFSTSNEIVGINESGTVKGFWHVESDTGTDDSPDIDFGFKIQFPRREPLKFLNGKWAIVERDSIKLSLLSYTSDDWEYLTFEKVKRAKK